MQKMVGSVPASGVGGYNTATATAAAAAASAAARYRVKMKGQTTTTRTKRNAAREDGHGNELQYVDRASFGLANCRCCCSLTLCLFQCLFPSFSSSSSCSSCICCASLIVGFWRRLVSRRIVGICIRLTRAQVQLLADWLATAAAAAAVAVAAGELTRPSRISLICVGGIIRGGGRGIGRVRRRTLCNQKHLTPKENAARQSAIVKDEPNTLAQMRLQACIDHHIHPHSSQSDSDWRIEDTVPNITVPKGTMSRC